MTNILLHFCFKAFSILCWAKTSKIFFIAHLPISSPSSRINKSCPKILNKLRSSSLSPLAQFIIIHSPCMLLVVSLCSFPRLHFRNSKMIKREKAWMNRTFLRGKLRAVAVDEIRSSMNRFIDQAMARIGILSRSKLFSSIPFSTRSFSRKKRKSCYTFHAVHERIILQQTHSRCVCFSRASDTLHWRWYSSDGAFFFISFST